MYWKIKKIYSKLDPIKDNIPWITYSAIAKLDGYIKQSMKIFEWGSGGSTLYFARKVDDLISVEHDDKWYKQVKKKLQNNPHVKCLLRKPIAGNKYVSSDGSYRGLSFVNYCKEILNYPDEYFDLVLVDGRSRNDCVLLAMNKIKPGGYLVLDNSERDVYKVGIKRLLNWERVDFFGSGPINIYPWQTSFFKKPSA